MRPLVPPVRVAAILLSVLAGALPVAAAIAAPPPVLPQSPDIHGDLIVFCWEGDLWRVAAAGGPATRLTSHPGNETAPKISPDGATIAFTGEYDGVPAVYTIPVDGGEPMRLTWFGSGVRTVAWTPDGKRVIFRSSHENTFRPIAKLYSVDRDGGWPQRLPMDRGILCSFNADGTRMVYNRPGNEEYYWKRYKGGQYTDIWLYDFRANSFAPLTDYVGKNAWPMWAGDTMFFVSDRGPGGTANLFAYDFATKAVTQATAFDGLDVHTPSCDGRSIVFVQAGGLKVFDITTRRVREVPVTAPSDRWQLAERTINPRDYIQSMGVSDDGKLAVFEARGDIFVVPADENAPTRNLTDSPGVRERFPQLSPDGKRVAYFSDRTGEYQVWLQDAAGDRPAGQLTTTLDRAVYHLEWSPDGRKLLFGDKDFALWWFDVASKKLTRFAHSNQLKNDEFSWEVSDYCWSPDSRWIAYSFVQENHNNRIFLYDLDQDRSWPLTDDFYDCLNPSFDADGKHLWFLSYRNFAARIDIFEDNHVIANPVRVMVAQLQAGQRPPFAKAPQEDDPAADKAASDKAPAGKGARGKPGGAAALPTIEIGGLGARIFEAPVKAGNYFYLKAGKGLVTFAEKDRFGEQEIGELFTPGGSNNLTLHLFSLKDAKDAVLEGTVNDWRTSAGREQAIVRRDAAYHLVSLEKLATGKVLGDTLALDRMSYRVRPRDEWAQIFTDAWRWYRDFFYDENMHGHDWQQVGDKFRALLPGLASRADLNWLLSQMVGELCVSHTYVGGGDQGPQRASENPVYTGLLGADLIFDGTGFFRFQRVFGPTDIDRSLEAPLARPDVNVREWDFLLAIDGREVRPPENPYRLLQVTKGRKVRLTVNSKPTLTGARTVEVEPIRNETQLRYNRWLADNVAKVLMATNGEVGYMHIQAMGTDNTGQFDKFWRAFRYKKGLIIDVRSNGGGWTEYFMIDKLERNQVGFNVLRNMEPFRYPGSTSTGQLVVLSNEYNGSDGEAFLEHFRAAKLGTIIGVPSWGGLVGIINTQRTIDNGTVEQSNNSFYGSEGKWWVENHGVDPDILVDNDPASASAGQDAQLDRAIATVQEKIRANPAAFPAHPPYPVR